MFQNYNATPNSIFSSYISNKKINNCRYPFSYNPNEPLQNTNYKDWLNICSQNQHHVNNSQTFEVTLEGAVVTGLTIISTIIAIEFPIAGLAFGVLGAIIGLFWPKSSVEDNSQRIWEQFMNRTEEIMDQKITNLVKEIANAEFKILQEKLQHFYRVFNLWKSDPNQQHREEVAFAFREAHNSFTNALHRFSINGYQTLLLTIYAQAANLHLLLLQGASIYGSQWGLSRADGELYYKIQMEKTIEYANYCTKWYNAGLADLRQRNTIDWNSINIYRREMTIKVLDIISLFSSYDSRRYKVGTKVELTREIYTDTLIDSYQESVIPNIQLEDAFIRPPTLFTWLRGLDFYTLNNMDSRLTSLNAFSNLYSFTNDNGIVHGPFFGDPTQSQLKVISFKNDEYVFKVAIEAFTNNIGIYTVPRVTEMIFDITNNKEESLQVYSTNNTNSETAITQFYLPSENHLLPEPDFNNYSHILSTISSVDSSSWRLSLGYALGWTYSHVDSRNSISENRVTQVPAVKGNHLGLQSQVIKGPGHTGGNLVYLKDRLEITCQTSNSQKSYFIRIRYASNGTLNTNPTISLTIPGITGQTMRLNTTFFNEQYKNLKYQDFNFLEFPNEIKLDPNRNIVVILNRLDNNQSTDLLIDKIEFLPITDSTRENVISDSVTKSLNK
ncbi:insecticidal delta-endotoxin Cry8Ea1 family protein [Bacillus cereus]|uniref:insecticidal delta-endotoxin Cry8Ea1 family protein n=1 Tax=Bacillus cereus TaxID=1396 RepID=UPI003D186DD5